MSDTLIAFLLGFSIWPALFFSAYAMGKLFPDHRHPLPLQESGIKFTKGIIK